MQEQPRLELRLEPGLAASTNRFTFVQFFYCVVLTVTTRVVFCRSTTYTNLDTRSKSFPGATSPTSRHSSAADDVAAPDDRRQDSQQQQQPGDCVHWPRFLQNRPVLRLFLVITFNGLVSMMCAAIFIQLEGPAQEERFAVRARLQEEVSILKRNLSYMLGSSVRFNRTSAMAVLRDYSHKLSSLESTRKEIQWDMLSASAFVTSVSSTTGEDSRLGYANAICVISSVKVWMLLK